MLKIEPSELSKITFNKAKKKPIVIECKQIHEPFQVDSREGLLRGKKGDWLMKGVEGELYICDDDIFRKTYDLLD